jgi:hypothetical protein
MYALGQTADSITGSDLAGLQEPPMPRGEPPFIANWHRVLMIHFGVEVESLQRTVPFVLDLWEGRAYVTLVAFTLRGMRLRFARLQASPDGMAALGSRKGPDEPAMSPAVPASPLPGVSSLEMMVRRPR